MAQAPYLIEGTVLSSKVVYWALAPCLKSLLGAAPLGWGLLRTSSSPLSLCAGPPVEDSGCSEPWPSRSDLVLALANSRLVPLPQRPCRPVLPGTGGPGCQVVVEPGRPRQKCWSINGAGKRVFLNRTDAENPNPGSPRS